MLDKLFSLTGVNPSTLYFILMAIAAIALFYLLKKNNFSNTGNLNAVAVDMTNQAKAKKLDPVIGRQDEIERLIQILCRRTKNNAILLGMPGVGKTAIVEGLSRKIASGNVPDILLNKRVLKLQVSELISGTKYRGEFEKKIKGIVNEISHNNRTIILFIDEIHTVTQTKGTEGGVNLSDILKPALARGDLQLVGATTKKEYETYIQPDQSWERRFQVISVDEPTVAETIKILKGIKENYENYHKVKISDQAIEAAAKLSKKYVKERNLPDKAIDLIDEAASMINVERGAVDTTKQQKLPIVQVSHIKKIIADWTDIKLKNIK